MQDVSYEEQVARKQIELETSFRQAGFQPSVGFFDPPLVDSPFFYRNKSEHTFFDASCGGSSPGNPTLLVSESIQYGDRLPSEEVTQRIQVGFFAKIRSQRVIPIQKCFLVPETTNRLVDEIRNDLATCNLSVFERHISPGKKQKLPTDVQSERWDRPAGPGFLRTLVIRSGHRTGEFMVALVTNPPRGEGEEQILRRLAGHLVEKIPVLKSVLWIWNHPRRSGPQIEKEIVLWGQPYLTERLEPAGVFRSLTFRYGFSAFFQVNSPLYERLIEKVAEYAGLTGCETVLDLYGGIGCLGLFLAGKAKHVVSVELNSPSQSWGKENAEANGIANVDFSCSTVKSFLKQWTRESKPADVVVIDPPRAGMDKKSLKYLWRLSPGKIIYVSCSIASLVRDIQTFYAWAALEKKPCAYTCERVQLLDFFPQTVHFETIVLLTKHEDRS